MAETSQYLSTKTEALTTAVSVSPSQAQAAQIPLQSFNLPCFPPEAFTAGLGSLILTSDIKLDEYTDLLTQPFSVPKLPSSVQNLTLELFALGYPPGFLSALGKHLPNLKSLTIYSQLFAGTIPASREDAVAFLRFQTEIQELHLLDVFGSAGAFVDLANALSPSLKFLEVSYTYRHSDPNFLDTIPSTDIAFLIEKGLVALTLSISAPDVTDDEDDREGTEVGVRPVVGRDARTVAEKLIEDGAELIMLDLTMFELNLNEVIGILGRLGKLKVLSVTVALTSGWGDILEVLSREETAGLEVLEIVGAPGEEMIEKLKSGENQVSAKMFSTLNGRHLALRSVKISVLRTKTEHWVRDRTWRQKN